ncbi:unnamed protein product [Effrenium voratum]|uniref:Uncharacterized protein n=1 Tax=Effrenium voratum TaxID=2562239 RepID=A0AA36J7N0_9DINO|nr:unnamed protein product [Effrenium voratum]
MRPCILRSITYQDFTLVLEVLASTRQLPDWSQRCAWRDELDIRAGQLERISLQFDTTKRSLDAANEELQWQATSAEALRIRLADVLRATAAEVGHGNALHTHCTAVFAGAPKSGSLV